MSISSSFNPLPSHEGRREGASGYRADRALSIHFPLTREDAQFEKSGGNIVVFQSTSLSRGKTLRVRVCGQRADLSIHFPLTREDMNSVERVKALCLSIHFPLTREDAIRSAVRTMDRAFNPLPSHEGRLRGEPFRLEPYHFQSTSLSRGKTSSGRYVDGERIFQSTSLSRGKTYHPASYHSVSFFQSTSLSRGKTTSSRMVRE